MKSRDARLYAFCQQITATVSIAAPPMRAMISAAADSSGVPSSSHAVSDGKPASARPAPASTRAVTICKLFMVVQTDSLPGVRKKRGPRTEGATFNGVASLVSCSCSRFARFCLIRGSQQHRPELNGQLVDLSVERERQLIVRVHSGAGVEPDIES